MIDLHFLDEKRWQSIAFDLFRTWTRELNVKYPKHKITIKDERIIVEDVKSSLTQALQALFQTDEFHTSFIPGWDIGYVYGFMIGSLNTQWYHTYVAVQTDDYKTMVAMQTIRDYLKLNSTLKIQLTDLYVRLLNKDNNLESIDSIIHYQKLLIHDTEIEADETEEKDTIIVALNNMINAQISKTVNSKIVRVDLNIENVLDKALIKTLIKDNQPTKQT